MKNLSKRELEKIQNENIIIDSAEELFSTKGFENSSMNELAQLCGFTKRTIYKYFTCKEDLYFAVLLKSYGHLLEKLTKIKDLDCSAFEKIRLCYSGFSDYSKQHPAMVALLATGSTAKLKDNDVLMPYRDKFNNYNKELFTMLISLFKEGQDDNSVISEYDYSKLGFASIFSMTGFFLMLASSGETFTKAFNLDEEDFLSFSIELLTNSFKNK